MQAHIILVHPDESLLFIQAPLSSNISEILTLPDQHAHERESHNRESDLLTSEPRLINNSAINSCSYVQDIISGVLLQQSSYSMLAPESNNFSYLP